jgi:hypothetical protein
MVRVTSALILKLLSFTLAFVILDTLITYYSISLEWIPSYLETSIVYNLYGIDAFLLGKLVIGSLVVIVFYIKLRDSSSNTFKAYNAILLIFTSISWFAVISNLLVLIDISSLVDIYMITIIPVSVTLLTLHGLWWFRLKP